MMMQRGADAEGQPGSGSSAVVRVQYEHVDGELLGLDPRNPVATDTLSFCSALLGILSPNPESCVLTITGDFVASVQARLPAGARRDEYTIARGAGMVGGKTMQVSGEVHVLLPAELFVTDDAMVDDPDASGVRVPAVEAFGLGPAEVRFRLARRTLIHEAQHVAMTQAGEDSVPGPEHPWVRRNFLSIANQIMSEYRAERGVPTEFRDASVNDENDVVSGLRALRANLSRIAAVEYQAHLNVERLQRAILEEAVTMWKLLAYFAAARRVAEVPLGQPVSALLTENVEWSMMAAPHWVDFEEILSDLPSGMTRIDANTLAHLEARLADMWPDWLATLGFAWNDCGDDSEFLIMSWDLLE